MSWYVRCFQCGRPCDVREIMRGEVVVQAMQMREWWGWKPWSMTQTGLQDLCPSCCEQNAEAIKQHGRRAWYLWGGCGISLFLWTQASWPLVPAALLSATGLYAFHRFCTTPYVSPFRKKQLVREEVRRGR
jgi:hypothetical protein